MIAIIHICHSIGDRIRKTTVGSRLRCLLLSNRESANKLHLDKKFAHNPKTVKTTFISILLLLSRFNVNFSTRNTALYYCIEVVIHDVVFRLLLRYGASE